MRVPSQEVVYISPNSIFPSSLLSLATILYIALLTNLRSVVIQEEPDWESDHVYVEAISDNYIVLQKLLLKFIPLVAKLEKLDGQNSFLE